MRGRQGRSGCFGAIQILGIDIELDRGLAQAIVLCRLDLKKRELFIYHEDGAGRLEPVKKVKYTVKNIDYA